MKPLMLATLTALLALISEGRSVQAQALFTPTAEGCAAIIDSDMQEDCQEAYQLRQVYQDGIREVLTIYQLAELRQPTTVWVAPGYGEAVSTVEPPVRMIVLQQFVLAESGEPWIHVRFAPGSYGFIQTRVVE